MTEDLENIEQQQIKEQEVVDNSEDNVEEQQEKKLGDLVEEAIKIVAPKLAEKYKDCQSCKKRKKWLNNINGIFS